MPDRIINARDRFRRSAPEATNATEIEQQWKVRKLRQEHEATALRAELSSIPRLDVRDRKILVRNLGRVIERKLGPKPTKFTSLLFRTLYGEDGGASKEKKRKRYIRFDGEPLSDHDPGEFAANGREFLTLIEGAADLLEPEHPKDFARNQILMSVCDGATFFGPSRPRLSQDVSLLDNFQGTIGNMIDRIVRETDIVTYLNEVRNYTIQTHPHTRDDSSPEVIANLYRKLIQPERFEHSPNTNYAYDEYSRLRLGGFDIQAEEPSSLYPRLRLARIYWPRQMLCLPAFVPTCMLDELRTRELSKSEIADAIRLYERSSLLDTSDEIIQGNAISCWRDRQEYEMWRDALSKAGFNPDAMDWWSFEDKRDGTALKGAEWQTFWQAISVDLYLVADGRPDALQFGLSFGGGTSGHWTDAIKDLACPADDDMPGSRIECVVYDEHSHHVPWLPVGEKSYVCRGFVHNYLTSSPDRVGDDDGRVEFEDYDPPILHELSSEPLWPLQQEAIWHLLTMRMKNWHEPYYSRGLLKRTEKIEPRLRLWFDTPDGWSPAPDGSIASAILRGLAYGDGDRLDGKIITEVNNLVRCFRDMKDELSQGYEQSLAQHGYGTLREPPSCDS
jgi:hypothetical protein